MARILDFIRSALKIAYRLKHRNQTDFIQSEKVRRFTGSRAYPSWISVRPVARQQYPRGDAANWRSAILRFSYPAYEAALLAKNKNLELVASRPLCSVISGMNVTRAVDNPKVREALNYAIIAERWLKWRLPDYATPATPGRGATASMAYAQKAIGRGPMIRLSARTVEKEAGYPDGFGTTFHDLTIAPRKSVAVYPSSNWRRLALKRITAMDAGQRAAKIEGQKGQKKAACRYFCHRLVGVDRRS